MDRFLELTVFVAVAENRGFASAARQLQMSPPAVTRVVAGLEKRLGIMLLNRTTRYVRVNESGERYLEDARRILAELACADNVAVSVNASPMGVLAITAPVFFGKLFVMPSVVDYLQKYPQTQVSVALLDRVVNLLEEGFDASVRIGPLPDSTLRATTVGSVSTVVCAAPEYLLKHGEPSTPSELPDHMIITVGVSTAATRWRFTTNGKQNSVRVHPRLSVTNNEAAIVAAKLGCGLTRLLSYQVADAVADGSLKIVLGEFESARLPIHIVHREGRVASSKVRIFIDLMAEHLRAVKSLNP